MAANVLDCHTVPEHIVKTGQQILEHNYERAR